MQKLGLYLFASVLAVVTMFAGLLTLASFMNGQPSSAPIVFVVGLVGMVILAALDSAVRKPV